MRFVIDTNVVSAVMRGEAQVLDQLSQHRALDVGVPQPVVAEIAYGIARLPRSKRRTRYERDFERLLRTLPRSAWTDEVSARFGELKAALDRRSVPLEDFDVAIAAHALVEGATLVTANIEHFRRVEGLEVVNWLAHH